MRAHSKVTCLVPYDHFIAQTYLKHFLGASGPLQAYRKSDLASFPCWPNDICGEIGGDTVPDFLGNSAALGQYRAIFEPGWKPALENLQARFAPAEVKLAIAGYMANLLLATPAMTRLTMENHSHFVLEHARSIHAMKAKRGQYDPRIAEAITSIDSGDYFIETERDWARAKNVERLMHFAAELYDADWIVIENLTPVDFITSDNPFAFDDPGPFRGGRPRLPRYLPLTPKLSLHVEMDADASPSPLDPMRPPLGRVRFATTDKPHLASRINRIVARCAEELVIASGRVDGLADTVAEFAKHRVSNEFITVATPGSRLLGIRMRVWDPARNVAKWTVPSPAA